MRYAALLIGLLISLQAGAGENSLQIAGVEIRLGMPIEEAKEKLSSSFNVECGSGVGESCIVKSRGGPPFRIIANIASNSNQNGKITYIRRYWADSFSPTASSDFAKALFDLLSAMSHGQTIPASVAVNERREPGSVEQKIWISAGGKTIEISMIEGLYVEGQRLPASVNLDEVISAN